MKKIALFIAPLLAVTFLANCGGVKEYKISVTNNSVTINKTTVKKNEDLTATISVNETAKNDYSLPTSLSKVTVNNVELTATNYTYSLKENGETADFSLSKDKINGDISISLDLVDRHYVNASEFNNAIALSGVEYVQVKNTIAIDGALATMERELSSNVYRSVLSNPNYYAEGIIVKKEDGTYDSYMRSSPTADYIYQKGGAIADNFFTPTDLSNEFKGALILTGMSSNYEDFEYRDGAYCYTNSTNQLLKMHFANKKLSSCTIEDASGQKMLDYSFTYNQKAPEYPKFKPLTPEEFIAATTFADVIFMQTDIINNDNDSHTNEWISTHVSKLVSRNQWTDTYNEKIVSETLNEETHEYTYRIASRDEEDGEYTFEDGEKSDFITPQNSQANIEKIIDDHGILLNDFAFDENTGSYNAISGSAAISIEFNNKKVSKLTVFDVDGNIKKQFTYTYENINPDVPVEKITQEEFTKAINFTGIEYMQLNYSNAFDIGTIKAQYSPTVYYKLQIDSEYIVSPYEEQFVSYDAENLDFKLYLRNSKDDNYTVTDASPELFHTPEYQDESLNIYEMLKEIGDGALLIDNYEYDITNDQYVGSFEVYGEYCDIIIKFDNKKVSQIAFAYDGETAITISYKYENITPDLPPVPVPSYEVTQAEFVNAINFADVKFLQVNRTVVPSDANYSGEFSPSANHFKAMGSGVLTNEWFQGFDGINYYNYLLDEDGSFIKEPCPKDQYVTPQNYTDLGNVFWNIPDVLAEFDLSNINNFAYDEASKSYSAVIGDNESITLKFVNKKITYFGVEGMLDEGYYIDSTTYAYNTYTPVLPF